MRRIPELDGLRGLAAITVVSYHMNVDAMPFGWMAVDLFFVLSGYLITGIILRDGGEPGFLKIFYIRRGLRIWPIYYLWMIVTYFVDVARPNFPTLVLYATYCQRVPNYWFADWFGWYKMDHTWSLAVEEQFYLIWPTLVILAGGRRLIPLACGCVAAAILARAGGLQSQLLLCRCDGLALGAILAAVETCPDFPRRARRLALLSAVVAGVAALWCFSRTDGLFAEYRDAGLNAEGLLASFGSLAIVVVTLLSQGTRATAWLRVPPLVYLGKISYGFYIYHWMIYLVVQKMGGRFVPGIPISWLAVPLITLSLAALSWHFIEAPILRLKDQFHYRRGMVEAPFSLNQDVDQTPDVAPSLIEDPRPSQ